MNHKQFGSTKYGSAVDYCVSVTDSFDQTNGYTVQVWVFTHGHMTLVYEDTVHLINETIPEFINKTINKVFYA